MAFTTKDWRDSPDTSTPITAAALEDLETRLGAYTDRFAVGYQTSLPGSPADGDVIAYAADATNGVIWNLRYRSGAAGSYKWEFIGGPPLYAEVVTQETTASTSFAALATAGPTVTVPLAGDYLVTPSCAHLNSGVNNIDIMSYDIGGTGAVDADACFGVSVTSVEKTFVQYMRRKTITSASSALTAKYKVTAGTGSFALRTITALPIRVG